MELSIRIKVDVPTKEAAREVIDELIEHSGGTFTVENIEIDGNWVDDGEVATHDL